MMVPNTDDVLDIIISRALIGISSFDENKIGILLKKDQDWRDVVRTFRHCFSLFIEDEDVYEVDDKNGHPSYGKNTKKWYLTIDFGEEKQIVFTKDTSLFSKYEFELFFIQDDTNLSFKEQFDLIKLVGNRITGRIIFSDMFAMASSECDMKDVKEFVYDLIIRNISTSTEALVLWR